MATLIGDFVFPGVADASGAQYTVTDIAVNAAGDIYINTETEVYQAVLPTGGTGTVTLTNGVAISAAAGSNGAYFYALAFTPPGALGPGSPEYLIGGDGSGNLWSINPATGASVNLGNFGNDPTASGNFMALSGDIVFYQVTDSDGGTSYQGLATIRSCTPNATNPSYSPTCGKTNDYLAGRGHGGARDRVLDRNGSDVAQRRHLRRQHDDARQRHRPRRDVRSRGCRDGRRRLRQVPGAERRRRDSRVDLDDQHEPDERRRDAASAGVLVHERVGRGGRDVDGHDHRAPPPPPPPPPK